MICGGTDALDRSGVFSCSVSRFGDHVAVGVFGTIDRVSAGQLRNHLLTLAKEHPASIDVDFGGVAQLDAACVAVLVEAWRFAEEHGIDLTVRPPCDAIASAFDVTPSGRLVTLRS